MADYTTIAKVEAYTLQDITASFEDEVGVWIKGMSRFADGYCNRKLVADGSDTVKYYDGENKGFVAIDDCQSITTVELGDMYGDNLSAVSNYITYPRIAPYRAIILKSGVFTAGWQNVKVTGDWGYLANDDNDRIEQLSWAVTVLVGGIINAQNPNAQAKQSERIGNYQVTYTTEKGMTDYKNAMATLDSFKRLEI